MWLPMVGPFWQARVPQRVRWCCRGGFGGQIRLFA